MTTELSTKPRAATFAERCVWGVCPVCGAAHGDPCDSADASGSADGEWFGTPGFVGAHRERLTRAPIMVRCTLEAA